MFKCSLTKGVVDGEMPPLFDGEPRFPKWPSSTAADALNVEEVGGNGGYPLLTDDKETTDSASFG